MRKQREESKSDPVDGADLDVDGALGLDGARPKRARAASQTIEQRLYHAQARFPLRFLSNFLARGRLRAPLLAPPPSLPLRPCPCLGWAFAESLVFLPVDSLDRIIEDGVVCYGGKAREKEEESMTGEEKEKEKGGEERRL